MALIWFIEKYVRLKCIENYARLILYDWSMPHNSIEYHPRHFVGSWYIEYW